MKKKISISMLALVVLITTLFSSMSFAATVGQRLTVEEAGWTRYDDFHPLIKYDGTGWTTTATDPNTYAGTGHYTTLSGATSNSISFKFYGSKLRIIDLYWTNRVNNVNISIDGVQSSWNPNNSAKQYQVLVFESLNLPLTTHEVIITTNSTSNIFSIDAIDIDSTGYLINSNLEVPSLTATTEDLKVNLNWPAVTGATSYNVKRSTTPGGPYVTIATSVTGATYSTYTDENVAAGVTYYYVVTAINASGESAPSNEVSATPQFNGRALVTITMTNGLEKEYDLSTAELNAFLAWYDAKDAGSGPAKYKFVKTWNKGPFKARSEYVIFDKILTFDVDEYDVVNP